ncbi:MAG: DUF1800 domain-containing protein [Aliivibrio sp.]|uniref:DUF1800 domain-containing protein n=1 Tax=Aliivibrio sp. TaxID=1872443 RepID=UPI001A520969|nr:DUF1800 domain-containing protein [Aliivibrio sp.]
MSLRYTDHTIATQRFGFGPVTGEIDTIKNLGAALWLEQQLSSTSYTHPSITELPSTSLILQQMHQLQQQRKQTTENQAKAKLQKKINQFQRSHYTQQVYARNQQIFSTPLSFQERIIQFWSNHFSVSADNRRIRPFVASIENEVIRTHWNGDFSTLLRQVSQHPAMLIYLDNNLSIGPDSTQGKRADKGLNENLAREILELHTLGVNGGYTQQDIIQLAKAITGWSVNFKTAQHTGFIFNNKRHQPGTISLLNKDYNQAGLAQGEACLNDLAMHPSTAHHIARKLAQHFAGPHKSDLEKKLADTFMASKGQLMPVYKVLIHHPDCWHTNPVRFRTPQQWLFSMFRSANFYPQNKLVHQALKQLGQEPFMAGSPAGWSDNDRDYNSSSALTQRWQLANKYSKQILKKTKKTESAAAVTINNLIASLYDSDIDEHLFAALSKTDDLTNKLTLLWLSPQFQYR